jgi:hypothetical protein
MEKNKEVISNFTKIVYLVRYPCPLCPEIMMTAGNVFFGNYEFMSEKNAKNYIKDKNLKNAVINEVTITTQESIKTI